MCLPHSSCKVKATIYTTLQLSSHISAPRFLWSISARPFPSCDWSYRPDSQSGESAFGDTPLPPNIQTSHIRSTESANLHQG